MFEKESQDYAARETAPRQQLYIKGRADINADYENVKRIWQDGANFGYTKGKEEAKEIIKMITDSYNHKERFSFEKDLVKAEQFLKEIDK